MTVVIAVLSVVGTLLVLGQPLVAYRVGRQIQADLESAARSAKAELVEGHEADEVADRVGARTGTRITVVDRGGRAIGDTGLDGPRVELAQGLVDAALVRRARLDGVVSVESQRRDRGDWLATTLVDVGDGRVVQATRTMGAVEDARTSLRELLVLGCLTALVIGLLVAFSIVRGLVRPAKELGLVAEALARGDLSVRTRSERDDEIGALGRAIDGMAEQLAARMASLHAEEGRLTTVLDAMSEGVFVTDERGQIAITNQALEKMLKTSAIGKTAIEAIRSPELHRAALEAQGGRAANVEFEMRFGDEPRFIDAHLAPLPTSAGVVVVLHDVTRLKMIDRVRRDFVANASHELRTPLTAIRGYAETLKDGAIDSPQAAKTFLDIILRHTIRLSRIVDDLVTLSRAESPDFQMELSPLDVGPVIVEVVRGLESQASKKGQQLVLEIVEDVPKAITNEGALDQVLVNLVDNAIKYTPEGGSIRVRASASPTHVVVEVHNSGPGIPEPHLERLFERFYRVDPGRSRDQGGTGLGLAIVKHMALRMKADVTVESGVGKGATFRVFLPREGA